MHNSNNQIQKVKSFEDLIAVSFVNQLNAICWERQLEGDFEEIIQQIELDDHLVEIEIEELKSLNLSAKGDLARQILLNDFQLLHQLGASPSINIIEKYERDDSFPFFPTDVYSFHVDRSPIPTATFLCTYWGAASELVSNSDAIQKIQVPEIRDELRKFFKGNDADFDAFLSENFFDLHYHVAEHIPIVNLGIGNMWKLAVDHPDSNSLPCVHRAPLENNGEKRLLLIC